MVAGVERPVGFQPLAAGSPVARRRVEAAAARSPCPAVLPAARRRRAGIVRSPEALGVALRLRGVNVDADAVRAATAVRAPSRQATAFTGGREQRGS